MSDARLRDLERRWKETGSVDEEAAYLLERVRVGDLTQERLELAAYCGHEGARRALGDQASLMVTPSSDLGEWIRAVWRIDAEAIGRLCVAGVRATGTLRSEVPPWEESPASVLRRAEECLLTSNPDDGRRVRFAALRMTGDADSNPELLLIAAAASLAVPGDPRLHLDHAVRRLEYVAQRLGVSVLVEAARREVAPWALGSFDPIRARVLSDGRG